MSEGQAIREGNVTVRVSDMDRSVRFYTDQLGLPLGMRAGDEWAEIQTPGLKIGLHREDPSTTPSLKQEGIAIGFMVDDIKSSVVHYRERGIEFARDLHEDSGVILAFFNDPDGMPLYLCELKHR